MAHKLVLILFIVSAGVFHQAPQAMAQTRPDTSGSRQVSATSSPEQALTKGTAAGVRKPAPPIKHDPATTTLTQSPKLPDLPTYTGYKLKLIRGQYTVQSPEGRSSCMLNYHAQEAPAQILSWYENALNSAGYEVERKQNTGLKAFKKAAGLFVWVKAYPLAPSADPGYITQFEVRYLGKS